MNLALLFEADFVAPDRAVLMGRRLTHLHQVLKVAEGDVIPVGQVNGRIGQLRSQIAADLPEEAELAGDVEDRLMSITEDFNDTIDEAISAASGDREIVSGGDRA